MDVSKNRGGPPKSSILIRFSNINHPFWGTSVFGNTHMKLSSHIIYRVQKPLQSWKWKKGASYRCQWTHKPISLQKKNLEICSMKFIHHPELVGGWTNPLDKICSSNWIMKPSSRGINTKYLKPPPRKPGFFNFIKCESVLFRLVYQLHCLQSPRHDGSPHLLLVDMQNMYMNHE